MKNKFWRLGLRAMMDKACQREIMASVAQKAKASASALAVPLMLAAAVAVLVVAAAGLAAWSHVNEGDKTPQLTLLSLDASERALLSSTLSHYYPGLEEALKKANASAALSKVFLGPEETRKLAKNLRAWANHNQPSADDARAAAELLRMARSGASWEEASARLRSMTRGPTQQERWIALEAKLKAAPRFDVGVMEVFVAFWPGERGGRGQALSAELGPFFLVNGVMLLLMAVVMVLLVVGGGMAVVEKVKDFIGRHRERLESEVEASDLKRASLAAPKNQNKNAGRI